MNNSLLSALFVLCTANAGAHIVLETPLAQTGSSYRAVLKVGHGCDGSATTQIVVKIPDGVQGAKPMPKAGWRLDIVNTALAKPYTSHGRTVTEDVSEVRWTAKSAEDYLANAYYDEFVIVGKLPDAAGKLYWKISQICEQGRIDWVDIPNANGGSTSKSPAAVLEVKQGAADSHVHAH